MAKDRPWNRPQANEVPDLPQTEDAIGLFRYKGAAILKMTDSQIRDFCLEKAKLFLYEAQVKAADAMRGTGREDLTIAAHYATIAQAFRPGPAPE